MHNIDIWLDKLAQDNNSLIIVEGKRDKKALNELGINNVILIDKPIYLLIEEITRENKKAIILTDFDLEGRKLYSRIKNELNRNGIKVKDKYRILLSRCKIVHVEGLFTYYRNNSKEFL